MMRGISLNLIKETHPNMTMRNSLVLFMAKAQQNTPKLFRSLARTYIVVIGTKYYDMDV